MALISVLILTFKLLVTKPNYEVIIGIVCYAYPIIRFNENSQLISYLFPVIIISILHPVLELKKY